MVCAELLVLQLELYVVILVVLCRQWLRVAAVAVVGLQQCRHIVCIATLTHGWGTLAVRATSEG